jgi:hypothetical protein
MKAGDFVDHGTRLVSRTGERDLHQFSALTWITTINGFASQFRTLVPTSHWKQESQDLALVDCVCRTRTNVDFAVTTPCEGCERVYLFTSDALYVANSPNRREETMTI